MSRARKALLEYRRLAGIARITGSPDDHRAAGIARSYCQHRWFAVGDAMRALPDRERELVEVWDHAAAMTWWYRTSDRREWTCFEAAVAQIIAALPNGVDSASISVVITANARRRDIEIHWRRDVDPHPSVPDGRGSIDQQALLRLLRENLMDVLTDNSASVRADQALRHFEPWLCESMVELTRPQSQDRLLEITERWRALGTQFLWHNTDQTHRKASAE